MLHERFLLDNKHCSRESSSMKDFSCSIPQNGYRSCLFSQPAQSKYSYTKIRLLTIAVIVVFTVALGVAFLHHHEDGQSHSDCALCIFLIQPAVSSVAADLAGCLSPTLPEEPDFSGGALTSLCFMAAPFGRAPPAHSG
jgi:hypothetical protein